MEEVEELRLRGCDLDAVVDLSLAFSKRSSDVNTLIQFIHTYAHLRLLNVSQGCLVGVVVGVCLGCATTDVDADLTDMVRTHSAMNFTSSDL